MARIFSGRRLRERRLAAGLKAEQLALGINRSVWTVHQYERGSACPSAPILGAIADELSCSIDDLYGDPVREVIAAEATPAAAENLLRSGGDQR
ncbi:helix-turn-helix domain-containing protein [Micromonosporaceae bacterium Da 78-11]